MSTDEAERVFRRSVANDPTPLADRSTWSILDELNAGEGDTFWLEQLALEIMRRSIIIEEGHPSDSH